MSDYLAGLVISSNIFNMTNRYSVEIITAPCHRVDTTSQSITGNSSDPFTYDNHGLLGLSMTMTIVTNDEKRNFETQTEESTVDLVCVEYHYSS